MDDRKLIGQEETDELEHYGTPRHSGRYLGDLARIPIRETETLFRMLRSCGKMDSVRNRSRMAWK